MEAKPCKTRALRVAVKMTAGSKFLRTAQLEGRILETFFNTPVEDYVENVETAEVSTSTGNVCTGCTE
jgi:hypothetical protein